MRFSIIVPVYNQESYIGECLDSVLAQTLSDYEIVLVDDGSTDGSAVVCDNYAARDARISVIHQSNAGPSTARNTGVAAAKGEYLIFLDGDDMLAEGALAAVDKTITRCERPDLIICGIDRFFIDPSYTVEFDGVEGLPERGTGDEYAAYVCKKRNAFSVSPCRYAINRSFYNASGVSFKPGLKQEDELFTPLLIAAAGSFGVCRSKYYLYRRHEGSRNNTPTALNKLSFISIADALLDSNDMALSDAKRAMLEDRGKFMFRRGLMEHNEVIKDKRRELVASAARVYKKHPEVAESLKSLRRLVALSGRKHGIGAFLQFNRLISGGAEPCVADRSAADINELKEIAQKTVALRTCRGFRRKLNARRFKQEVLFGNRESRKDYRSFIFNKLGVGKSKKFRPLSDFDPTNGEESAVARALIAKYSSNTHNRQIAVFSRLQYYTSGGGQRGAQLAKTFAKLGYDVVFLYSESNYYSFDKDFIEGLSLHLPISYFDPKELAAMLGHDAIAIFEHPDGRFLPYLKALKENGASVVYEQIDNWDSELGEGWYRREDFYEFISNADLLIGTANNLCDMVAREINRKVLYSPNAVDLEVFDCSKEYTVPKDLRRGKKTLLYYGHLSGNWLDWPLLFDTAVRCPDCCFNIIGYGEYGTAKKKPSNVYFLGAKLQSELPAYLAASDFALLHFNTREVGSYVSPIKVFEYLAMHRRVLAAPLPDIEGYPNVICSNSPAAWAEAVNNPPPELPYDEFVSANSWIARCRSIIREVDGLEQ